MTKSSRRSFSKLMASSLVSLPLASLADGRTSTIGIQNQEQRRTHLDRRNQHDTPPPLLITQGSLIIEIDSPLMPETPSGGRRKFRREREATHADLDHIKIVDGSGEILYRNDNAMGCEVFVRLTNITGPEIKISGGEHLILEAPASFVLGASQTSPSVRRRERYRPSNELIFSIVVRKRSSILYFVTADDVVSELEDARIMIWHQDARTFVKHSDPKKRVE